jgi:hypothetical protein
MMSSSAYWNMIPSLKTTFLNTARTNRCESLDVAPIVLVDGQFFFSHSSCFSISTVFRYYFVSLPVAPWKGHLNR